MAGMHPEELELLAYVEGELDDQGRREISAHLETCDLCARDLHAVEAGRAALRSAPTFELPAERMDALLARLPSRTARRPGLLQRALPIAAALAAVAALAGGAFVLGTSGRDGDRGVGGDAGGGGTQRSAEASEGTATDEAGGSASSTSAEYLKGVRGSAKDVARELRRQGFDARVSGKRVVVHGAQIEAVQKALEPLGPGSVQIVVRP